MKNFPAVSKIFCPDLTNLSGQNGKTRMQCGELQLHKPTLTFNSKGKASPTQSCERQRSSTEQRSDRSNGIFSKWSKTFTEFREFRESEKSLRHELGSV